MDSWGIENQKIAAAYTKRLAAIYDKAISHGVGIGYSVTNPKTDKPFSFSDYPVVNKKADKLFSQVAYEVQNNIAGGTQSAWALSGAKNDILVDKMFAKSGIAKEQIAKYYDRNLDALAAFQKRVDDGISLSDRVWKYTGQFKNEIELAVSIGIGEGRSAAELSRDIRGYLQEPEKLFHKVKNVHGELVLSKAAKAYHPGQGVYRSSYKNAMRLTRTEINMAYQQADAERYASLDFIAGFQVVVSNGHLEYDICDVLAGVYPKSFSFWGWHPQCLCHTIPLLAPVENFTQHIADMLKGKDVSGYIPENAVYEMPPNFKQWAIENQARIETANSMPYFIDKNFTGTNVAEWFKAAEKTAAIVEKTVIPKSAELTDKELEKLAWKQDEIVYAKKKIAEADKFGVTGAKYDALKVAIKNESLTYSQIAGKSDKLVQEIKAAKLAAADPFSEAALLKTYSKQEVENLFAAYEKFKLNKLSGLNVQSQISKIEYEISWLSVNGKYSTSGVLKQMLEKDLALMQKELQFKLDNMNLFEAIDEAKSKITNSILTGDKGIIKAANDLATTIGKKGVILETVTAKAEKLDEAFAAYYKKKNAKINSVKPDWSDATYAQKRKDAAMWEKNAESADPKVRGVLESVWGGSTELEKRAAYRYTAGSSYINEPLRQQYYSGKYQGVYNGAEDTAALTNIISRSSYDFDMWIQRGVDTGGLEGVFNIQMYGKDLATVRAELVGKTGLEPAFSSCANAKGAGFSDKRVIYNIYCPKGTKMLYSEPFSEFGRGAKSASWDGISKQYSFGSEAEMLLQRGTKFRVTKVDYSGGQWFIDVEVIGQL